MSGTSTPFSTGGGKLLGSGGGGSYEMVKIDPAELEAALRHDAENAAAKHGDLASGGDTGS